MTDDGDVTQWLDRMAQGDQQAIQRIWEQYYRPLTAVARQKLGDLPRRMVDEEDVVLSAFNSFCAGVAQGRFPELDDRDDLWRLLVTITARKAVAQLRWQHYQKRGGGAVRGDSVFLKADDSSPAGFEQVFGRELRPEVAAAVAEEFGRLMDVLDDPTLRVLAYMKFEGSTNEEIARSLECAVGTVERKLARIRKAWSREQPT
jgi:DNA-directed RNA polymerase specialized sigma24 family protein